MQPISEGEGAHGSGTCKTSDRECVGSIHCSPHTQGRVFSVSTLYSAVLTALTMFHKIRRHDVNISFPSDLVCNQSTTRASSHHKFQFCHYSSTVNGHKHSFL